MERLQSLVNVMSFDHYFSLKWPHVPCATFAHATYIQVSNSLIDANSHNLSPSRCLAAAIALVVMVAIEVGIEVLRGQCLAKTPRHSNSKLASISRFHSSTSTFSCFQWTRFKQSWVVRTPSCLKWLETQMLQLPMACHNSNSKASWQYDPSSLFATDSWGWKNVFWFTIGRFSKDLEIVPMMWVVATPSRGPRLKAACRPRLTRFYGLYRRETLRFVTLSSSLIEKHLIGSLAWLYILDAFNVSWSSFSSSSDLKMVKSSLSASAAPAVSRALLAITRNGRGRISIYSPPKRLQTFKIKDRNALEITFILYLCRERIQYACTLCD